MTNFDYRTFKEDLKKRFYWCYSTGEKKYLTEKGYKYLFRCTHFETGNFFWVYDVSDASYGYKSVLYHVEVLP